MNKSPIPQARHNDTSDDTSHIKTCCKTNKELLIGLGIVGTILAFIGLLIFAPQIIQQIPFPPYLWSMFFVFWGVVTLVIVFCLIGAILNIYGYCKDNGGYTASLEWGLFFIFVAVMFSFGMIYFVEASWHEINVHYLSDAESKQYIQSMNCDSLKYFEVNEKIRITKTEMFMFYISIAEFPLRADC